MVTEQNMLQSLFLLVLQIPQGYCVTVILSPSPSRRTPKYAKGNHAHSRVQLKVMRI